MISFPNKNDHQNKKLLALLLAFVLAATTISGCGRLIPKIGQVTDAPKSGQSGAGTGSAGAGGQSAGTGQSGADGENAGLSAELFTLPYDDPDPDEKASAYPWLCSDIVENVDKLGGLTETDDFHAAVNRDWLTSNEIPTGYYSYDTFAERQLEVDDELVRILESRVSFSDPYIAHCQKLVQDYYRMWLDWDARDAAGIEPLRDVVQPLLDVHNLDQMTYYLSDPDTTIRALPLCGAFTAANPNDADNNAVYITPPSLVFSDPTYYDYLEADSWETQPRYMQAAGYMLERLGYLDEERDQILKDSYAFECEMAAHMMTTEEHSAEDSSIRTNNPRSYADLVTEQGDFPLTGMLEGAGLEESEVPAPISRTPSAS